MSFHNRLRKIRLPIMLPTGSLPGSIPTLELLSMALTASRAALPLPQCLLSSSAQSPRVEAHVPFSYHMWRSKEDDLKYLFLQLAQVTIKQAFNSCLQFYFLICICSPSPTSVNQNGLARIFLFIMK